MEINEFSAMKEQNSPVTAGSLSVISNAQSNFKMTRILRSLSENMVRSSSNEKRLETSSSSGNLQKLSKKLVLRDRKDPTSPSRSRSISLDWGDARSVKHLSAMDGTDVLDVLSASPSVPTHLSHKDQLLLFREARNTISDRTSNNNSPRIMRDIRMLTNSQKKKSMSVDIPDCQLAGTKRRSERDKRGTSVLDSAAALFDAVELQQLDVVKSMLDYAGLDVNTLNSEDLSVLDIAVMTNNIPMAKMLLSKGAKESPIFQRGECRLERLELLVAEAERRVIDLTASVLNGSSGNANISPAQQKENEKQLAHWEFRHKLLKRMKAGYEHAKPPEPPTLVRLDVASNSSLLVTFSEPRSHNGAVVTRYKVEWSSYENFLPLTGEAIIEDLSNLEFEIKSLTKGSYYFVRVCAWNVKGYGPYANSEPASAAPSSWREVDGIQSRLEGKVASLYTLYHQVKRSRPPEAAQMKDLLKRNGESPMQKKKISIKNLFISAPKFQKSIKRGVYMACLLYNEDKLLVTSEEQLPIIEVDETFSGPSIQNDLYWLLKISCMWEEAKVLKQDMEKTSSAGSTFRCKLLQAVISLQNGLGIQDLGQFFHRPVRDSSGSIIFVVVNQVRDPKIVTLSSGKWVTFGKLARRQSLSTIDSTDANSLLISCVPEMMLYHQVSGQRLTRGLYLGYVKLQASVEVLRVMVPNRTPSSVPHVKMRECPNVSREEWEWLLRSDSHRMDQDLTDSQTEFKRLLSSAARKLFNLLDLSEDTVSSHRIYDLEVLELSPTVTMILIMPSIEDICIAPGHSDSLAKRVDYSFLPVQIFESIHMQTYLPEFFSLFARLSAIVEMDGVLAQQGHREAFSSEELYKAKERVEITAHLQQNLDRIWKCARWIRDVTTYARNREKKAGIHLSHIVSGSGWGNSSSSLTPAGKEEFDGGGGQRNNGVDIKSKILGSRLNPGTLVTNSNGSIDHASNNNSNNLLNNNHSTVNHNNLGLHRYSDSLMSSKNTSANTNGPSMTTSHSGVEVGSGVAYRSASGRAGDVRLMAKFYDPNEANPHSTDSISIIRGHSRSADVSPTALPVNASNLAHLAVCSRSSYGMNRNTTATSAESATTFGKSSSFSSSIVSSNPTDSHDRTHLTKVDDSALNMCNVSKHSPSASISSISTIISSTSSSSSSHTVQPSISSVFTAHELNTSDLTNSHTTDQSDVEDRDCSTSKTSLQHSSPAMKSEATSEPSSPIEISTSASSASSSQQPHHSSPPQSHSTHQEPQQQAGTDLGDSAIVKVHAMYETGLRRNVNIKLHISEQTTSRDIVDLVVKHLNTVVQRKGKGAWSYAEEALRDFCLVLNFQDGREVVLRDADTPLALRAQLHKARVCVTSLEAVLARRRQRELQQVHLEDEEDDDDEMGRATIV